MTNQVFLPQTGDRSKIAVSPRLSQPTIKKAQKIAVWSSIVSAAIIAVSQQPLFGLPVSVCLGLNLLSRQQQAKIEQQLVSTTIQLEKVKSQYAKVMSLDNLAIANSELQDSLIVQSQQLQQLQQQFTTLSDRKIEKALWVLISQIVSIGKKWHLSQTLKSLNTSKQKT